MTRWLARKRRGHWCLSGALAIIASLVSWWAVFANRLIYEHQLIDPRRGPISVSHDPRRVGSLRGRAGHLRAGAVSHRPPQPGGAAAHGAPAPVHQPRAQDADRRVRARCCRASRWARYSEASRAELLDLGIAECDRLEHLAETILAYQRSVAHGARVTQNTQVLLEEVLSHRKKTMPDERVELSATAAALVWADRDAFRVIVENLLGQRKEVRLGQGQDRSAARRRPLAARHL